MKESLHANTKSIIGLKFLKLNNGHSSKKSCLTRWDENQQVLEVQEVLNLAVANPSGKEPWQRRLNWLRYW